MREALIAVAGAALCVALLLGGSRGRLAHHLPVGNDNRLTLCLLQWNVEAVRQGKSWHDLWQLPCLYPEPYMLATSDPFLGGSVLYAPLYLLTGAPVLAFNLWAALVVALDFLSAYLVARHLLGRIVPALFAAVLFTVPLVKFSHADHWHLWQNYPTPVIFLAAVRMTDRPGWRWPLVGGLGLTAQFYLSMYLGYMAAVMAAVMLATLALYAPGNLRDPRFLGRLFLAGMAASLPLLPLVQPYAWAVSRWGGWIWELTASQIPGWQDFFGGWAGERTAGWGWVTLVLAPTGAALVLRRLLDRRPMPYWQPAAVVLVATLTAIAFNAFGSYRLLYDWLPGFRALRCPARFTVLTVWPLGLLGGLALARLGDVFAHAAPVRTALGGLAVVGLTLAENVVPFPWCDVRLADEAFYRTVVRALPDGPYADFPFSTVTDGQPSNRVFGERLQGAAAAGWRPTLNVFTSRDPVWLQAFVRRQADATTPELAAAVLGEVRLRGVRYAVLHKQQMPAGSLAAWRAARTSHGGAWGKPVYEDDGHLVLDLADAPAEARLPVAWALPVADPAPRRGGLATRRRTFGLRPGMPLRPGRYQAAFEYEAGADAPGRCEVVRLQPETTPLPVVLAARPGPGVVGRVCVRLEFTVPDEPGPEPVLEFRLVEQKAGRLRWHAVTVTPGGP